MVGGTSPPTIALSPTAPLLPFRLGMMEPASLAVVRAAVASPALLRPLLHGLLAVRWAADVRLFPNVTFIGHRVGKATDGISSFPGRIPLLSYNVPIVPKFCWLHLSLPQEQVLCRPAKSTGLTPGPF